MRRAQYRSEEDWHLRSRSVRAGLSGRPWHRCLLCRRTAAEGEARSQRAQPYSQPPIHFLLGLHGRPQIRVKPFTSPSCGAVNADGFLLYDAFRLSMRWRGRWSGKSIYGARDLFLARRVHM